MTNIVIRLWKRKVLYWAKKGRMIHIRGGTQLWQTGNSFLEP